MQISCQTQLWNHSLRIGALFPWIKTASVSAINMWKLKESAWWVFTEEILRVRNNYLESGPFYHFTTPRFFICLQFWHPKKFSKKILISKNCWIIWKSLSTAYFSRRKQLAQQCIGKYCAKICQGRSGNWSKNGIRGKMVEVTGIFCTNRGVG